MTHARQHRSIQIVLSLVVITLALLTVAPASQAKVVVDSFGFRGQTGGHVNTPAGIAINQSGAGGVAPGTIYAVEGSEASVGTDSNRVQRFGPEGNFERLWGFDVVGPNEIHTVTITFGAKGGSLQQAVTGSFTLSLGGDTAEFAIEGKSNSTTIVPTREELQSGLEALPSIGTGNVRVRGELATHTAGGSFEIEFTGARGGTDLEELVIDGSEIQGPAPITAEVSTEQDGFGGNFAGFEICTVAAECKRGSVSEPHHGGQVSNPAAIAVNQTTGDVYVANRGNNRIEVFDADGSFLRAFGRDVVAPGGTGNVSEDAFEICTMASDCKQGTESESGGAISFTNSLLFDPSGHLWIADGINNRFQEFEADGSFLAAYGWDVDALGGSGELEECTSTATGACQAGSPGSELGQFRNSRPITMTIDSAGFVYAIDETPNNRIQRFTPEMTAVTQFAPELLEETGISSFGGAEITALPGGGFLVGSRGGELFELDESGSLLEVSLAGAGVPDILGLARNETTGAIYAALRNAGNSPGIAIIEDGPATSPTVAIEPPNEAEAEAATFNATVDPTGVPVAGCKFQYSTDQVAWQDLAEPDCASLDVEGGSQQVSEPIEGLEPGTKYFVRFSAGRFYNPDATVLSGEEEFTTPAAPPILTDVGAAQVTDTSAYLAGEIKPRSQASEYHFEYGTSEALGSSTPTVQLSGSKQRVIAHELAGLEPSATYHLKLVAENVAGTTESAIVSFETRPTLPPAGQRAYEQVTPPDKNFGSAGFGSGFQLAAAADGEAAYFCGTSGFGNPAGQVGFICTDYRAARTPSGWRTRWFSEPLCSRPLDESGSIGFTGSQLKGLSENLDLAAFVQPESASCVHPPLDPAAPMPQLNLYRADYRTEPIEHDLLTREPAGELRIGSIGGEYAAASDDWSHVVFTSSGEQTADAPAGDFEKVFDWHEGAFSLVSVDPADNPFSTSAAVPQDAVNGVSAGGNRIFFMSPAGQSGCTSSSCAIYMRQANATTYSVSESECTSACGEAAADEFLAATPSGAKAVFKSKEKLTDEDAAGNGSDLYLYTHTANPPANDNLTLLSRDMEPADGTRAEVLGLLGLSDDGETAYFVAEGQLVPGGPTKAGPKVYRWQANGGSPTLDYLAALSEEREEGSYVVVEGDNWAAFGTTPVRHGDTRSVTPDGEHLIIHSLARIDPAADHDSDRDVYRWSEADGWLCLSCQAPGAPSAGRAKFSNEENSFAWSYDPYRNVMTEDGGQVFFTAYDALDPKDASEGQDVYEWREDGSRTLISTGTDSSDILLIGASTTGRDVFFTTYRRLVGWDTDTSADIYDARIGGGFPEPPSEPAPCEGEACRGAPSSAPSQIGAGSAALEGPGNPVARRDCRSISRRARRLNHRVRALRRGARRLARQGRRQKARKATRHARRTAKRTRRLAKNARRCRKANARKGRSR